MEDNPYRAPALSSDSVPNGHETGQRVPDIQQERRGRTLAAIAVATTLFGDAVVISLKVARWGAAASGGSFVRWLLTAALFYAVLLGHRWAWWLMMVLMGSGFLMALFLVFYSGNLLALGIAVQIGVTLGLFAFAPSVSAFLASQRARRKAGARRSRRFRRPMRRR